MTEQKEIEAAMKFRAETVETFEDRLLFQRDFAGREWFTDHPAADPVNEVYYYDFQEKRNKVLR